MVHFIGIEGGGTKFVCVHGTSPDDLQDRTVINTRFPDETLHDVVEYIRAVRSKTTVSAIGASVFGPLDLDRHSPTYGRISTCAKPGWAHCDFVGVLKREFDGPIGFDTDVNAAALGEYRWGAAQQLSDFAYFTIGTGIGGGAMIGGKLLHGAMHPEMGHIFIPQDTRRDPFEGYCPYHKNCFEGLASGPALKARWKVNSALDLGEDHVAWDLEADYLAIGLSICVLMMSPQRIILGGGVMRQKQLFPKVRQSLLRHFDNFIKDEKIIGDLDHYIVPPGLGENSGICGGIALAEYAFNEAKKST